MVKVSPVGYIVAALVPVRRETSADSSTPLVQAIRCKHIVNCVFLQIAIAKTKRKTY